MSGDEETSGIGHAVAAARPDDPAGLVLARARVEGALFGAATGLGRFHVLERLGRGGMGVVYAAYDPELDRGVALKMIHVPERGRELALTEAKALARLSHPNVVPVFDVGVFEDHVYIVMELVRGVTLREWVKGRPARAIVEVYLQAGAALAAAHDAGLVHRDFKPENAIVGADGRVRVVDFGLAIEAAPGGEAAPHGVAGTPRYMAPEQAAGTATPASDQYSFCVSLDEALRGAGAAQPPRRLAELVQRGRSPDPAARFASMRDLLRALARDPSTVWRRRIGAGVLAAATGAAFLLGRAEVVDAPEPCAGGDAEIAAAWPRQARDAQLARLAGLGSYGGELARRIAHRLDDHAARWAAGHRDACLAHRRGVHSAALLDRRMACLAGSRAALAALAEIVEGADAKALPDVARAQAAIPDPAACADVAALTDGVEPPPPSAGPRVAQLRGDLARARIQLAAGRAQAARDGARRIAAELRALGYAPLLAEALLVEGHAAMRLDPPAAVSVLGAATTTAVASRADAIAIEAWARRAWIEGMQGNADAALAGLDVVDALAARTPSAAFARALLHMNAGALELMRCRRPQARAAFERALGEAARITGPGAVELSTIRLNMALVTDPPAPLDQLPAAAHADLARLLGEAHPDTLRAQYQRATTSVVALDAAAAMLDATCERLARYDRLAPLVPSCVAELGDLRSELGDRAGALAAYERSSGLPHLEHPEVEGYLALWRGDARAAVSRFASAIASAPPGRCGASFEQYLRWKLELGHAQALRAAGQLGEARAALERGLAAYDLANAPSTAALQRRLARWRAELAAVLAATAGPPARVRELAGQALAWYRTAGAPARRVEELEALTRGSP